MVQEQLDEAGHEKSDSCTNMNLARLAPVTLGDLVPTRARERKVHAGKAEEDASRPLPQQITTKESPPCHAVVRKGLRDPSWIPDPNRPQGRSDEMWSLRHRPKRCSLRPRQSRHSPPNRARAPTLTVALPPLHKERGARTLTMSFQAGGRHAKASERRKKGRPIEEAEAREGSGTFQGAGRVDSEGM